MRLLIAAILALACGAAGGCYIAGGEYDSAPDFSPAQITAIGNIADPAARNDVIKGMRSHVRFHTADAVEKVDRTMAASRDAKGTRFNSSTNHAGDSEMAKAIAEGVASGIAAGATKAVIP